MNVLNKCKNNFLLIALLTGAVACSSKPVVTDFSPSASPSEEIANLENGLKKASERQVDVLSPTNFREAKEALNDAKENFRNGKDSQITLREVALGNAYLSSANTAANLARENAEGVVAAREAALRANAPVYFGKEFKEVDRDFTNLTKDIEKNKLTKVAKVRPELQEKYMELELKAIKENHLRESRNIIALAKKEDAKKFAPRTLAIAEKSFSDTEAYITANRHNEMGIKMQAKETREAATHVLNINRIAKGTDRVSSEEMALAIEQEKQRVAMKQSQLETVEDELQTTQSALQKEKEVQATLAKSEQELEALKRRDEQYEVARKSFTPDEAEVYKQGDNILIRLKGMEFPSAQATIQSKNYPLLSKVQKVIGEFGTDAAVTIEGHTDSVGGKKINHRLSTQRAMAVKEYLESNIGGLEKKIEAVGFGDEKPIAGNKTATGRAQNRRVDIVIKPESTQL